MVILSSSLHRLNIFRRHHKFIWWIPFYFIDDADRANLAMNQDASDEDADFEGGFVDAILIPAPREQKIQVRT